MIYSLVYDVITYTPYNIVLYKAFLYTILVVTGVFQKLIYSISLLSEVHLL